MSRFKYISIVVLGIAFLLCSEDAFAQKYYNQSYKPSLHKMKNNSFNARGMSFGVGALYYFGDMDGLNLGKNPLIVLQGITMEDISFAAFYNYNWPLTDHFGLQAGIDVGMLRGNNKNSQNLANKYGETPIPPRHFMSVFAQPNVGINIFPIDQLGFVIHFGIAATASYIVDSYYESTKGTPYPKPDPPISILPMGQVSIGYNWDLTNTWRMGVFGAFKMGFFDMKTFNLDGWPVHNSATTNGAPDGYFEIGVTINYYEPKGLPFFR